MPAVRNSKKAAPARAKKAMPKYQKRAVPLPKGARSKVSSASRLRAKGLVKQGNVVYSKRTGQPVNMPKPRSAGAPKPQGAGPLDFLFNFTPGGLIKEDAKAIKRATGGK